MKNYQKKIPAVKGIRFQKNFGKSQALDAGFEMAKGAVVITMDADLQDNPEEIPDYIPFNYKKISILFLVGKRNVMTMYYQKHSFKII